MTKPTEVIEQLSEFQTAVERFLTYLRVERNASEYTTKSYREDLTDLETHFTEQQGVAPQRIASPHLICVVISLPCMTVV